MGSRDRIEAIRLEFANLIKGMTVGSLNQVSLSDITHIRIRTDFVYLAALLEAFWREAIGYAVSMNLDISDSFFKTLKHEEVKMLQYPASSLRVISRKFSVILRAMDKMFLVDKPKGLTSSRVVEQIKKRFNVKAGHTGTLDPLATGLLIVLTGKRTKNASLFLKLDKAYEVKAVLGVETDTFDCDGKVVRQTDKEVTKEELEKVLKVFLGDIWQTPPPFSAKKVAGRKAYQLARKGLSVDIPPKKVSVYSLELKEFRFPYFTFACEVSSGFYVRSLVHDIGEKLGVGATVLEVRRTRVGPYRVEQAKSLDEILGCK